MLCTTVFEAMARAEAEGMKMPDLRVAVVPHPLASRSRDEVAEMADGVVDAVDALLTRPPVDGR